MALRSSYHFPQELIFEILSYLPVKSLLRFCSVCKSWLSIISDQQFIDTHLTNSQKKPATLVLDNDFDNVYVDTREESVRLHVPPQRNGRARWMCSCNGIVCLTEQYGNVMYLWNPWTNHQLSKLCSPKGRGDWDESAFMFVYDSTCNDYKLLRLTFCVLHTYYYPPDRDYIANGLVADLYSSKNGNFKEINVPDNVKNIEVRTNSKCFHDLKTGVLYFEGSAAMVFEAVDGSVLSLWTLDDVCDDKVAWTKKFNIEADVKINCVFLHLGVGQFVAKNDDGHIFYDYKKKDVKKLLSPAPVGQFNSVVKYTESLVSLEVFQGFELLT
ncbi:F-box protein At3g17710-like [Daucus carota subsp. sativus]|uniref:F-box protein At3g17710-like n=1 Tax=Daucus carota subsp. sativus TaxID=79200 RepID=UPI003083C992